MSIRICKAPNCNKVLNNKNGALCQPHTYRITRYGSYDLPSRKPKRKPGYLMTCKVHGQLRKEQIQFRKRKGENFEFIGQNCLECVAIHGIKNRYKLDLEEYNALHEEQKGLCAICGRPESRIAKGKITRLAVDHCHKSEENGIVEIRGLLCFRCNAALGLFEDNPDFLTSAICYLLR